MMNQSSHSPLNTVVVYLEFDRRLQSLTGISRTSIEVTDGTPFFMVLQAVLESYPAIIHEYDLTTLGFSINGLRPSPQSTLSEHDVISLGIQDNSRMDSGLEDEYYH
ncbi:hypothetical protein JXA80_08755 [bacterium]|nr:hypothetical protein [candidate division CSSED10-310 bacterium]